jgi:AcrR family transcriptional regulator
MAARGQTRQHILDAALRLFAAQGYAGTSIRDIADALDLTKAAVHYHFPTKEGILEALVAPFITGFGGLADEVWPGPVEATVVFARLADLLVDASPLMSVLSADPSVGAALHGKVAADGREMGERLAAALAGPGAALERRVRAHAALSAFFTAYECGHRLGGGSTAETARLATEAALDTLGR